MVASQAASSQPVLLREDREGVATLTLNRPGQYNALSEELIAALHEAIDAVASDPGIRVLVLAARGRAFSAGHDLREMRSQTDEARLRALFEACGRMMQRLLQIPQPVVARVQGLATAAGCQLVATCDLAVAAASARFATSGINLGLFCSTPAVAVSRAVPRKQAFELLFTGDFVDAETAREMGLVNRVVEDEELDWELDRITSKLKQKSPVALRLGKELFYRQLGLGLPEAYAAAAAAMARNMMAEDAREGIDAFLEKRDPVWRGR
jgi:enoyl-CoA hydratase/carnithine racemase